MLTPHLQKFAYKTILGFSLLASTGAWAQSARVMIDAKQLQWLSNQQLLDGYNQRFFKGHLSLAEFTYAKAYLCPTFPPPQNIHLCNSNVVGTSVPDLENDPNNTLITPDSIVSALECRICKFVRP